MENIEIRQVSENDYGKFHPEYILHKEIVRHFSQTLPAVVAEDMDRGEIVGYIVPRRMDDLEARTVVFDQHQGCCINVLSEYENKGIASRLLDVEAELLRESGIEAIKVEMSYGVRIKSQSYDHTHLVAHPAAVNIYSDDKGWETITETKKDLTVYPSGEKLSLDFVKTGLLLSYHIPKEVVESIPWDENPEVHQIHLIKRKSLV